MKKVVTIIVILVLFLALFADGVIAEKKDIAVYLDGKQLTFDVQPTILRDRTMVPMRTIFETLGATVYWDEKTKEINAIKGDISVTMQIDNIVMTKNGGSSTLDVPPIIKNDRTLVPIRAVAETFDADVKWDEKEPAVVISTNSTPTYEAYPDVPDYGEFMGCKLISDKTVGETKIFTYQLKNTEGKDKYQVLLKNMGYQLVDSSHTKDTDTQEFANKLNPKMMLTVVLLPSLLQARIEIAKNDNIKIFIDAGHNDTGTDVGATGNGLWEQDITYNIALKLGALLEKAGIQVMYSRVDKGDHIGSSVIESIAMRSKMANDFNADYFISIHCNAFDHADVSGTETYIYSMGGQAESLADKVQQNLIDSLGTVDRQVKTENFGVLRETNMPSILVETAFITNKNDAEILKNKQDTIAQAIYKGICEFLAL